MRVQTYVGACNLKHSACQFHSSSLSTSSSHTARRDRHTIACARKGGGNEKEGFSISQRGKMIDVTLNGE